MHYYPPLIGLTNLGGTDFMNSTLQCLSQTESLINHFLKEKSKNRIFNNNIAKRNQNALQLSPIYLELMQKLWSRNANKEFSPIAFRDLVFKMNPLLYQGQKLDYKNFIIFILEQLHKELKEPVKSQNINLNEIEQLNQYNKDNTFRNYMIEFQKECSIISDIFFGINENTNICQHCKKNYNSQGLNEPICYNYGKFNCLIFPLEEVRKIKYNSNQLNQFHNAIGQISTISLYDCFDYNQKSEFFTGPNQNFCNICKEMNDSIYTSKIFVSPKVLILILDRGKIYDIQLDFSEKIDITSFIIYKDIPRIIYDLYGVITLIDQGSQNDHFIASCKSPIDCKWYRYNDSIVTPINDIIKDVIELKTPYILFYKKKEYN